MKFEVGNIENRNIIYFLTLEGIGLKKLHEGMGGEGVNLTPPLYF